MNKTKKALILVNVGTPDRPDRRSVRRYLKEFLNDKRVIDLPWLIRKVLVNMIIIPFRVKKSTGLYKRLWTNDGSPLLIYTYSLAEEIGKIVSKDMDIFTAMRYGKPSLDVLLQKIKKKDYDKIIIFPMYPQYAESTTGSVTDLVRKHDLNNKKGTEIRLIPQFWSEPGFIDSFTDKIRSYMPGDFDHIIFSYHGLPLRQINKVHPGHDSRGCICEKEMPEWGHRCYKAACYGTTRLLAHKLSLEEGHHTTAFQSRLTRNWLSPFTDETIIRLAAEGVERILLVAPSFVTDCLETLIEIEQDYRHLFLRNGGKELLLVKSLNDSPSWARAILDITEQEASN
ncbi:MAG: ferrochelatase [Bacteroidales bacterium]|nr:ferrochelatase [Bacteroidales bacterium]